MQNKIELGQKAKDKITGYKGILIGYAKYLTGCDQYCIKAVIDKDGKLPDGEWFDEGQIVIIGKGILEKEVKSKKPGGPQSNSPKV